MEKPIDELIQNLQRLKRKIISLEEIKNQIFWTFWENTPNSKIYKITYQLKNRGYLFPLRKEMFYITTPDSKILPEEIEEKRYRKLLKDHCNAYYKQRYISGLTALEIHLHWTTTTIPESIIIVNKEKQAEETIIFEKTIIFKKYEIKWKNLLSTLIKQTNEIHLPNTGKMKVANLELSILECLYNFDTTNKWYIEECIKKAIKKNGKSLDISILETIIKQGKHNTSLNRLYNLTKNPYPTLAEEIKKLIKKYGFILN